MSEEKHIQLLEAEVARCHAKLAEYTGLAWGIGGGLMWLLLIYLSRLLLW